MKRFVTMVLVICLVAVSFASAINFSAENTAKSVLKLFAYKNKDDAIYSGTGSGFIAFNSSTLITNYHVIDGMALIVASDDDDNSYTLDKVLCADETADIAILGFSESTNLKPLDLFPSDKLERGSEVVAIGSPKGLKNTVSSGVISSVYIENGIPWIQMTAPISPGSSGGALLNDDGYVIGVTTATYRSKDIFGNDTNAQNINFAVNIAVAQAMFNAWDGVTYSFANHKSAAKMDFSGVYVHSVQSLNNNAGYDSQKEQDTEVWTCSNCGAENKGRFCQECGAEKEQWICACGKANTKKFCGNCGKGIDVLVAQISEAIDLIAQNEFDKAIDAIKALEKFDSGSYETVAGKHVLAVDYLSMAYYEKGLSLLLNGSFAECRDAFIKANDYKDSREKILESYYREGLAEADRGNDQEAIELFTKAGEYEDAADKIKELVAKTVNRHLLEILTNGTTEYSEEEKNRAFDPSVLKWSGDRIHFDEKNKNEIYDLQKELFYEIGDGFLDMGFDPFIKTQGNDLIYDFDGTWLSINLWEIFYKRMFTMEDGDSYIERGYVPALVNGERTNLILDFTDKVPDGHIIGAVDKLEEPYKREFDDGELKDVAIGDRIQYVCDCITDTGIKMFILGEDIMKESMLIGYVYITNPEIVRLLYRVTDKEGNVYWTPIHH